MDSKTIQKYQKQTVPKLLKLATKYFNLFIRLRDTDPNGYGNCISCSKSLVIPSENAHAGHYYPATQSKLRFNEDNVHLQCKQCNYFKHGNGAEYQKNLVKKIGLERFEKINEIASIKSGFKWDRFTLIDIIETYKSKCKELQKTKMF